MIFHNLIVKGFQSHANVELSFSPGVNVICGLSNSGKTALLRAMNLVINNRPLGANYINHDMAEATVALFIGDEEPEIGVVRSRDRGTTSGSYTIEDGSSKPTKLTAIGTEPPLEIAELLNMGEINIQKQLSPYYLVLNTPGQIAKQIRKTAGLDQLDKLVRRLDGSASAYSTMVDLWAENLKHGTNLVQGAMQFDLEEFEVWVGELRAFTDVSHEYAVDIASLELMMDDIKKVDDKIDAYSEIDLVAVQADVLESERLVREADVVRQDWEYLRQTIKELERLHRIKLPDTSIIPTVRKLMQEVVDRNAVDNEINSIANVADDLVRVDDKVKAFSQDIKIFEQGIDKAKGQLDVCPACGSKLTDETKTKLLGHKCEDWD